MSSGTTQFAASSGVVQPDPSKHVNYTLGMLLGVDDFNQEFAYLAGRDQWMARDLDGYGTINGLKVSLQDTTSDVRLSVSSGTALSPRGQLICVHPDQCTFLNKWLAANQAEVGKHLQVESPFGLLLKLWLVVCYRDCPVDPVPIAGEPCRSADDLMANSRVLDDFRLELRFAPPQQQEEEAIRDFVSWLDQIQITAVGPFTTLAQFEDDLRAAFLPITSPIDAGTFFHMGSPLNQVRIDPSEIGKYLRAAFRIWVTEIRPIFHSCWPNQSCSCSAGASPKAPIEDECLLLAELDVGVVSSGPGWHVNDQNSVQIDESHRPILLHTRMLQEWMQSGLRGGK
jgi:hypothetical protein